jgi:uncharacterized protein (TIGR02117 family)
MFRGLPKHIYRHASYAMRVLFIFWLISACAACVTPRSRSEALIAQTRQTTPVFRMFVVVHSWHSGVVVPSAALTPVSLPEAADFPDADYLEFGWGNRDYYQGKRGVWVMLRAALWPTPGVLHVVACRGKVTACFPYSRIVSLDMPESALSRLVERLSSSFQRDAHPKAAPLGPGLYGESRFYPSHEKFYLLKTCNSWSASLLRAAGYPIRPGSLTVEAVTAQLKPYAASLEPEK